MESASPLSLLLLLLVGVLTTWCLLQFALRGRLIIAGLLTILLAWSGAALELRLAGSGSFLPPIVLLALLLTLFGLFLLICGLALRTAELQPRKRTPDKN